MNAYISVVVGSMRNSVLISRFYMTSNVLKNQENSLAVNSRQLIVDSLRSIVSN